MRGILAGCGTPTCSEALIWGSVGAATEASYQTGSSIGPILFQVRPFIARTFDTAVWEDAHMSFAGWDFGHRYLASQLVQTGARISRPGALNAHELWNRLVSNQREWIDAKRAFATLISVASLSMPVALSGQPGRAHVAAIAKDANPKEAHSSACADVGKGTKDKHGKLVRIDTLTDLLKNRIDQGNYETVKVSEILSLPWKGLDTRRYLWNDAEVANVAKYESAPVAVEGYLISVKEEGQETTNCRIDTAKWHDWHVWFVATESQAHAREKTKAVIIEITPRVRALNGTAFDKQQLQKWAHDGQRLKVSGWLFLDPDHPSEVGKSRGTIWEIHPVMKIEPIS